MPGSILLAAAFQILPFYQQKPAEDYWALRPLVSHERDATDVAWPVFTSHRDWWRFCYVANWQRRAGNPGGYQFSLAPLWFNGREEAGDPAYWGFFPLYGRHPHVAMLYDFQFALWPLWHRYKMPRGRDWLVSNSILFPFFSWRSDGAWSFWPLYGVNFRRESDHRYVLWPIVTWASYRADRDTAGAGSSWMVWPLAGRVDRERESQWMFLPPFFSFARTASPALEGRGVRSGGTRVRCPWPFFEYESAAGRERLSVWPFYERVRWRSYAKGERESSVTRFGWKLVEIYDDEIRVFPFWAGRRDGSYRRLWPFWESERKFDVSRGRFLALFPVRWVPAVDRNWAKFWTFYENVSCPLYTDHSLFWGIVRWRSLK